MNKYLQNSQFYERFTKVDDAIKFIKELENIDLSKITDNELEKLIDERFHIFPFTSGIIPKGTELFRARINFNQKPFDKVEDIFIPPKEKITKYGRANRPFDQIFYCSSNYELAAFEVIQDLKYSFTPEREIIFLTIGIWKTKVDLHVTNIFHSPTLHNVRQDIRENYEKNQKYLKDGNMPEDLLQAYNLVSQFFADQFTKAKILSHFDYRISALYSYRLKHSNSFIASQFSNERFDGINYPSVAMKYKGDNQALFFETATQKIELVNTLNLVCSNFDFVQGKLLTGVLQIAEKIEDGFITWEQKIYSQK